jgi:hypothetical protein
VGEGGFAKRRRVRGRGLSTRKEPLIRHGLRPRHLLPQGEKGRRSDPDFFSEDAVAQGQGFKRRAACRGRQRHADQGSEAEGLVHGAQARHMIKGIHLTDNADEIEGRTDKVKGLVLRTEF